MRNKLKKRAEKSITLKILLSLLFLLVTGLSLFQYFSDDTALKKEKSILNDEVINIELKKNEAGYREDIYQLVKKVNNNYNLLFQDSIVKNPNELKELKKIYIINTLKNNIKEKSFKTKVEEYIPPFLELEAINTVITIDYNKVENIINTSSFNSDNIKYGNYLNIKHILIKRPNYVYILIGLFAFAITYVSAYFYGKVGLKEVQSTDTVDEDLKNDKDELQVLKTKVNKEDITNIQLISIKSKIEKLELKLNNYDFSKYFESSLYKNSIRAEKKANEFYNRATYMLFLGIIIAVLGIIFFYITIPNSKDYKDPTLYLYAVIRPGLVLVFIQSISFYLLKQYRSLIIDYKYFYKDSINKFNLFSVYQLLVEKEDKDGYEKLIEYILNHKDEIITINNEEEKIDNEGLLKIVDKLIEKVK